MLLDFKIENFRSFKQEITFSMLPGKGARRVHETGSNYYPNTLKVAGIFGPNGSGKSNIVFGLSYLQTLVLESGRYSSTDQIPHDPFLLDELSACSPTKTEILFSFRDEVWRYGFVADDERIHKEWLYARRFRTSVERLIFTRESTTHESDRADIKLSPSIRSFRKLLAENTNKNQLFLSKLDQHNCDAIKPPYMWIGYYLRVIASVSRFSKVITAEKCTDESDNQTVANFLRSVDIAVDEISVQSQEHKIESDNFDAVLERVGSSIIKIEKNTLKSFEIEFLHRSKQSSLVPIKFSEESLGTQNLFALAGPLLDTFNLGFTLVIDELNHSFHSSAFYHIIDLFYSNEANENNAQLVFTSHDTAIMNELERDQIWLTEKTKSGESDVFPLSDFGPVNKGGARRDAAFGRQYLYGRFGALPETDQIESVKAIMGNKESK